MPHSRYKGNYAHGRETYHLIGRNHASIDLLAYERIYLTTLRHLCIEDLRRGVESYLRGLLEIHFGNLVFLTDF